MAGVEEEEVEYVSDPEEAKLSLTMRRREASDDEEEGEGDESESREKTRGRIDSRVGIGSDGESDGQGAAAEYDDDDDEELELEEEEEVEEMYEEEEEVEVEEEEYEEKGGHDGVGGGLAVEDVAAAAAVVANELDGERERSDGELEEVETGNQVEEGKKENEPFAVPTAGAFYMHDDRFRDSAGGRNRRTLGGRKLWESKDDRKWGHDKFEEMSLQERHYEEGRRTSRGHYRARGKNRGANHGYQRGNRFRAYSNDNQNNAPKSVRGRGPRRYEPSTKSNSVALSTQNKQSGRSIEKTTHANSGRVSAPASNVDSNSVPARKHVFASSLSSASPPFYPSSSSTKEITLTQKRDVPVGTINRNFRPSIMDENFSRSQSNVVLRGKDVANAMGMDKLSIDDSISAVAGKHSTNFQLPTSRSTLINATQPSQPRAQGRGLAPSGQMNSQPATRHNQINRVSPLTQLNSVQRGPVQSRVQPSIQQLGQRPGSGSQASSPPKSALSINSFEIGELESPPESSKSRTALVGKGKGSIQGSGRGSIMYNGAQVIGASGNMGGGHGDQNFPPTPAFLPVVPFGGQHPGGIGVPAVGMAFPGYVAQPQLGLGNSEMTWLPVLASAAGAMGAAGALGATYPYITMDGAYHSRPSGQSSSGASSKENNTNISSNELKPSQRPELASDEFGQRQNNPRRYSKINFGQ
ncbi:protein MLN51 homolog [Cornus florida]|uniref:protein MLN51 homolog n=1 Tax=Cornus florida TaxID=4283 RepID=UPI00289C807A|nr:protein MLN51 homolog [Cornus florida]XP_059645328.1 protein MLN51 homolog [Cornus florida]